MVGVSLTNPTKTDDKEQLVEANSADVFVTVLVSCAHLDQDLDCLVCFSL